MKLETEQKSRQIVWLPSAKKRDFKRVVELTQGVLLSKRNPTTKLLAIDMLLSELRYAYAFDSHELDVDAGTLLVELRKETESC